MAKKGRISPLQSSYSRGMVRDVSRHELPPGSVWDLVDYIPEFTGAPLRKRGGFEYASPDLSTVLAGTTYAGGVCYAPFSAGSQLLALGDNGHLFQVTSDTAATDKGASGLPLQQPIFYREKVIFPSPDGVALPKYYDGSTIAQLGTAPPAGKFGCVYADHLVLTLGNRIYFANGGDPLTFDTANSWIDASMPVTGLAALRNMIVVFGEKHTQRIIGSMPPPNSDMSRQDLFDIGCSDASSIVVMDEMVVWANQSGVYLTDGLAPLDLTRSSGLKSYWKELMASYQSTWRLVGGQSWGFYFVTIMNGTSVVDTLMFDVTNRTGIRLSNIHASMFAQSIGSADELWFASRTSPRLCRLSPMLSPSVSNINDADGTAVLPSLETGYFRPGPGLHGWKDLYVGWDLRDDGNTNPTLDVQIQKSIGASTWTSVKTLPETTDYRRTYAPLRYANEGVAVKITQTAASSDTRLYNLEAEIGAMDGGRS